MSSFDEIGDSSTKGKFTLTPPQSPTSVNSFGSQQNGHLKNNISHSPRHLSDVSDNGIDGHFKFLETYSPEYPDVFTITTNSVYDNKAYAHDTLSNKSRHSASPQPSSRGSTLPNSRESTYPDDKYKYDETDAVPTVNQMVKKTNTRKICLIILGIVLFLALAAVAIAVILVYVVFDEKDKTPAQPTIRPVVLSLEGTLDLNQTWSAELADRNSTQYKSTADTFILEIDQLMKNSSFNSSYVQTNVVQLSPGSIRVHFLMQYNDLYKLLANTSEEFARLIEIHIKYTAPISAPQIISITVNITVKPEPDTTTAPSTTTTSTTTTPTSISSSTSTTSSTTSSTTTPSSTSPSTTTTSSTTSSTTTSSSTSSSTTTTSSTTSTSTTTSSTTSSTTTSPVTDNPPVADAGPSPTIRLPANSVILNGSASTDDQGIVQYLWELVSPTGQTVDITGTDSSVLSVTNLVEGSFVFRLTVTDTAGQTDSDTVTVTVLPEIQIPPKADAGPDVTVNLPTNTTTLNGSASADDKEIVTYQWEKVSPPDLSVDMINADSVVVTLNNLYVGTYVFRLTVTDAANLTDTDNVTVTVVSACLPVNYSVCIRRGFTETVFPNFLGQMSEQTAVDAFEKTAKSVFNQICQEEALTYLCTLYFPKCNPQTGLFEPPCKSLCQEAIATCGNYFSNPFSCDLFQETECFSRTTTTVAPTTAPPTGTCEITQLQDCKNVGFNTTKYPNFFYEPDQASAIESFEGYFRSEIMNGCHADLLYFICSLQFPKCDAGVIFKPCRRTCEAVTNSCTLIAQFVQCDAYPDIDCMAPEEPKPACGTNEFTCGKVSKCVNDSSVCNGVNDCGDWTDEMDCVCSEFSYQCKMGMCIKSYEYCDGVTQCPDGSDEDGCNNCTRGQVRCPNGVCIMSEWLCDGRAECDDGWDEYNCDVCGPDQFTCGDVNHTCIDLSKRCDMVPDCPQGYDEWNCIKQEYGTLQLSYKKYWLPLCSESWHDDFGNYTCQTLLGEGYYVNKTDVVSNVYAFAKISAGIGEGSVMSALGPIELDNNCLDNKVVQINCNPRGCGKVLVDSVSSFIVNGNDATPGAWPWMVAMYIGGQFFCGGALIEPNFVLTAAHCFDKYPAVEFLKIQLGTFNRAASETTRVEVKAEALKINEGYIKFKTNDIAIIRLAQKVTYTDYIQPICLPEVDEQLPLHSECYALGWGELVWQGGFSTTLQELKMKLWDTDKCNSSLAWNGTIYGTSICAGYYSGVRTVCRGDSGGPLVCRDQQNTWKAFGVASYVGNYCNMTEKPNVYTNVSQILDWIKRTTECKFQCDNGKCIYESEYLCDRVDHCGDNSDEIKPCNRTVTCDFEDKYLCGYTSSGWELGYDNKQAASTGDLLLTQSHAPQYDHTVGHYPGRFFYGKTKEVTNAELWTPKFNTTGQTCIRFSYYQRGDISLGLSVYVYEYRRGGSDDDYTSTRPWSSGIGKAIDEWRTGYFDITLGEFRLMFQTGDLLKTAIDDVMMIPGMCDDVLCDNETEYRCNGPEDRCIARQSECNLVIDCDLQADEKNCIDTISYKCTFEDANLCALYQETDDATDWWVVNASFVRAEIGNQTFVDHTSMGPDGFLMYINTYGIDITSHVYMWQQFYLHNRQHCLWFFYINKAHVTFKVHVDCNGCNRTTLDAQSTFENNWTRFQISLPIATVVNVTYEITGADDPGGFYRSFIILDDINVKPGSCPSYVCQVNYAKCTTLDRCVPKTSFCDRKVDCADESDEQQCECRADEYQCSNGRCIPISQYCDRTQHCSDGSDEGSACDPLNSVSCTFEHPYVCGYTVEQYTDFHWQRRNENTPTLFTGPEQDHTFGNETGYYMYTEANEGGQGDNSSLFSPTFDTGVGQSVDFYYHLFSLYPVQALPGILQLSFKRSSPSETSLQWMAPVSELEDAWRRVCVDLPDNQNIQLVFTVIRNETTDYGVDMAIDDVKLNADKCSDVTVPSTSSTTAPTAGPTTCRPDQFDCGEGTCINGTFRCDGEPDCPGRGIDEEGCQ